MTATPVYQVAPFCRWQERRGGLLVRTPEGQFQLRAEARPIFDSLLEGGITESPEARALVRWGAAVRADSSVASLLRRLEGYFVDSSASLTVRRFRGPVAPAVHRFSVRGGSPSEYSCCGTDADPGLAMLKSVVERYERWSCDAAHNLDVRGDREPRWFSGRDIMRFAPWQYEQPGFPYAEESGTWATCVDPVTGERASVPFELVCYPDGLAGQPRCGDGTSNGVASHPDRDQALLASAYELIERDALMVHWFNEISRPRIIPPPSVAGQVAHLVEQGFTVDLVDLTLDLAPVVLALLRQPPPRYPAVIMGLGADPDPETAMRKALGEVDWLHGDQRPSRPVTLDDIWGPIEHERWYNQGENGQEVDFFPGKATVEAGSLPAGPASVQALWDRLQAHGLQWFAVELNRSGRERTRVYTFRSFIPGVVPITFGVGREPLGMARLRSVPASLGLAACGLRQEASGYRPHPLA